MFAISTHCRRVEMADFEVVDVRQKEKIRGKARNCDIHFASIISIKGISATA